MMSGNDFPKSQVLSRWRKVESDGDVADSGGSRGGGRGPCPPLNLWQFFDITYITLTSLVVLVHSFRY